MEILTKTTTTEKPDRRGFVVRGEYTDAFVTIGREHVERACYRQIKRMINHPAFQHPVRVMPDTHKGEGSVIGFTMPVGERIIPNVVGVDVGCGMAAGRLDGRPSYQGEELDRRIRARVPMGSGPEGLKAPDRSYQTAGDLQYETAEQTLRNLAGMLNKRGHSASEPLRTMAEDGFDEHFFADLCSRLGIEEDYALKSIGSLGGGNHFLEFNEDNKGENWVVVHSGSRHLGVKVAGYWQDVAHEKTDNRLSYEKVSDQELTLSTGETVELEKYVDEDGDPVGDDIREDFESEQIGEVFNAINNFEPPERNKKLDWLEGEQTAGYLRDMAFAQMYASVSRSMMLDAAARAAGCSKADSFETVHNYIDFTDGVIRKGAIRAHEGEQALIPLNMRDGSLLVEGRGNKNWNLSAPHGAGRVMTRHQADDEVDLDEAEQALEDQGVFAEEIPADEAPAVYKNADVITEAIKPTARVQRHLSVKHNCKAPSDD